MRNNLKKTEIIDWFKQELSEVLEEGERQEILLRLLEHHEISRLDWTLAQEVELDKEVWEGYIQDLKNNKPVQYILGYEYFAGEKFMVDSNVLIPRPETEELVNWIFEENRNSKNLNILEIGTGSGCIAISLKNKLPKAKITATDISKGALQIASQNADRLKADIIFLEDDILNSKIQENAFDIIVSNPPYIPVEESDTIDSRVKDHEPHLALFTAEKNPLQFYQAIINFAHEHLNPAGVSYFEVHENYAKNVLDCAKKFGFTTAVKKDIYGKERMVKLFGANFKPTETL